MQYFCDKEPKNTYYFSYIHKIFPNARFVYIIRDGRDTAYSFMHRKNKKMNFEIFLKHLTDWNRANTVGLKRCKLFGPDYCHIVKYESLVNSPESTIRKMCEFLEIEYMEDMLHHDQFLLANKLRLTGDEFIRKRVQKEMINNRSIGRWRNSIKGYDERLVARKIKLLKEMNYI